MFCLWLLDEQYCNTQGGTPKQLELSAGQTLCSVVSVLETHLYQSTSGIVVRGSFRLQ